MSVVDIAFIGVAVFSLVVFGLVVHHVAGIMVSRITSISVVNESSAAVSAFQTVNTTADRMDYIIFLIFIGFAIAFLVTSWFIPSDPIFMGVYWAATLIMVAISVLISNTWETVLSTSGLSNSALPMTSYIVSHLPIFTTVLAFIGIVILYGKPKKTIF